MSRYSKWPLAGGDRGEIPIETPSRRLNYGAVEWGREWKGQIYQRQVRNPMASNSLRVRFRIVLRWGLLFGSGGGGGCRCPSVLIKCSLTVNEWLGCLSSYGHKCRLLLWCCDVAAGCRVVSVASLCQLKLEQQLSWWWWWWWWVLSVCYRLALHLCFALFNCHCFYVKFLSCLHIFPCPFTLINRLSAVVALTLLLLLFILLDLMFRLRLAKSQTGCCCFFALRIFLNVSLSQLVPCLLLYQAWLTEIHEYAQQDVVLMLLGNKARHCGKYLWL